MDLECASRPPSNISHTVRDHHVHYLQDEEKILPDIKFPNNIVPAHSGSGTTGDPFIVDWDLDDPENPYNWSNTRRWLITAQVKVP